MSLQSLPSRNLSDSDPITSWKPVNCGGRKACVLLCILMSMFPKFHIFLSMGTLFPENINILPHHAKALLRTYIIWFSELPNRYSGFKHTSRRNRSFDTLSVHRLLLMLTYETMIMHVTHKIIMYSTCKLIHPVLTLYGRLMRRRLTAGRRFVCRTFFPADTEIFGAKKYIFLWRKTTSTQMDREKTNVKQTLVDSRFSRRSGAQIGIAIVSMVHKQQ